MKPTSMNETDRLIMNQLCKVCGEPAAGYHFGAFTCEGCKVSVFEFNFYYYYCFVILFRLYYICFFARLNFVFKSDFFF